MSVRRVMGTETEYAISLSSGKPYDPVRLSFDLVNAAAADQRRHIRWDYRQEDPINDARGHRLDRASARPDMLTDEPQRLVTNTIAANGGRIYVDHAHPEYSAPESRDPFEALLFDRAGDVLMQQAAQAAANADGNGIALFRNNVDGKGASWGSHENYMMLRSVPFERVAQVLALHFVSRQIYTGSGRVGIAERSEIDGFQLSQRADYFHTTIGLQTTFDRPIVNTRDESHSTPQYRRVHCIAGDANLMDVPEILKLGTTSMLLWMLEAAQDGPHAQNINENMQKLSLADPVEAMHAVSHDLSFTAMLPLGNGGHITALEIQRALMRLVEDTGSVVYGNDECGKPLWPDVSTSRVMAMWNQALADIARVQHSDDEARLRMRDEAGRLEWLFKWQLLEGLRRKFGASWSDSRLKAFDVQWAALDPQRSIFHRIQAKTTMLCSNEDVVHACMHAPESTRAWLRAELVRLFAEDVIAVSWTHIAVRDDQSAQGIIELDMTDPLAGVDNESILAALNASHTGAQALRKLTDIIAGQ